MVTAPPRPPRKLLPLRPMPLRRSVPPPLPSPGEAREPARQPGPPPPPPLVLVLVLVLVLMSSAQQLPGLPTKATRRVVGVMFDPL